MLLLRELWVLSKNVEQPLALACTHNLKPPQVVGFLESPTKNGPASGPADAPPPRRRLTHRSARLFLARPVTPRPRPTSRPPPHTQLTHVDLVEKLLNYNSLERGDAGGANMDDGA